jgi:uncharacterized protein
VGLAVKFMNFYPFNDIETISPCPMLFIAGDQAHSKEFSEDAYYDCVINMVGLIVK